MSDAGSTLGNMAQAALCHEAAASFHANHVEPWFGAFLDRVRAASREGFLGRAAVLARELHARLGFPQGTPDPLRVMPPILEPRAGPAGCGCPDD